MWSSLYVISASTEKLLFYADNLAILELVTKVHFLRLEQYQIKSVNSDDVTKTAMLLGNVIKNQGAMQGWHLDVEDNESTIPESWSNSCQTMLIGNFFNGGPLNEWLATSFGIDLLCAGGSPTTLHPARIPFDACFNYKAVIWRHFLSTVPVVPSSKNHGWGINFDERLVTQWMCGTTAPHTALQQLFCMCKRSWKLPRCIASTAIRTAEICAKLQTSSNQSNKEESVPQLTDRMEMKL